MIFQLTKEVDNVVTCKYVTIYRKCQFVAKNYLYKKYPSFFIERYS